MEVVLRSRLLQVWVSALVCFSSAAKAQTIDFETLPGGAPTIEGDVITDQYPGVTFSLLDRR